MCVCVCGEGVQERVEDGVNAWHTLLFSANRQHGEASAFQMLT